jgi:hypothetical protein
MVQPENWLDVGQIRIENLAGDPFCGLHESTWHYVDFARWAYDQIVFDVGQLRPGRGRRYMWRRVGCFAFGPIFLLQCLSQCLYLTSQ